MQLSEHVCHVKKNLQGEQNLLCSLEMYLLHIITFIDLEAVPSVKIHGSGFGNVSSWPPH